MFQRTHFLAAALAVLSSLAVACGDDVPSDASAAAGSAGSVGSGGAAGRAGAGGAACSTKPTTHVEIINACTDAQAIDVNPTLPLLQSGGALPPLP